MDQGLGQCFVQKPDDQRSVFLGMQPGRSAVAGVWPEDLDSLLRGARLLEKLAGNFGTHSLVALAGDDEERNWLDPGYGNVGIDSVDVES